MKFRILSHAGLIVEHQGVTLLTDPWVLGSAYWRSWWNFPPVEPESLADVKPDYIYLTHIHWDHFHGHSLRHFGKDIQILLPKDRYDRAVRDLKSMGFKNIEEIPHGEHRDLGDDFSLYSYQFFFPVTDSAAVIQAGATRILNANDCKIVGSPLKQILNRHGPIDFVLRSHSSANSRICHKYLDNERRDFDDKERYIRSFCNFVQAVKPRYAVPFASNHCYLHRDTVAFNELIQTPSAVADYFQTFRSERALDSEVVVMLPGSEWSDTAGFDLVSDEFFNSREQALADYKKSVAPQLEAYYQKENRVKVNERDLHFFFDRFFDHLIWPLRRAFRDKKIVFQAISETNISYWMVDLWAKTVSEVAESDFEGAQMRIRFPQIVFKQALRANMFTHAGISKRVRYEATEANMPLMWRLKMLLSIEEHELIPIRKNLSWRAISCYMRRWREFLLYFHVLYLHLVKRMTLIRVEQALLERMSQRPENSRQV